MRHLGWSFGWMALALGVALLLGCGDRAPSPPDGPAPPTIASLARVTWKMSGDADFSVDRAAVTRIVKTELAHLTAPAGGARRVRIVGELEVSEGTGVLLLESRVSVAGLDSPVMARVGATGVAGDHQAARRLVTNGVRDMARALRALLRLLDLPPGDLLPFLDDPEPDVQMQAAELVGQHKPAGAGPALCRLLSDPRAPVAEAAAEALIRIADPSTVSCVIQGIKKGDLRSEVRAIEIIGAAGGREAVAYLEMTALGHELEEVRNLSMTLLERLRLRE